MGERIAVVTGVLSLEPGHHHETYEGLQLLWGPGPAASRNVSPRLSPPAGPERAEHRSSSHWSRSLSRDGSRGGDWPAGVAGFPGGRRPGAAMASVHESLYFNPMMTNGVVHANVFGIKDWVTPYKMALLVLLSELGRAGSQLDQLERRRLNRLLLPLLQVGSGTEGRGEPDLCSFATCRSPYRPQGPDMPLSRLRKAIEECCPNLAGSVHIRWVAGPFVEVSGGSSAPGCPRQSAVSVQWQLTQAGHTCVLVSGPLSMDKHLFCLFSVFSDPGQHELGRQPAHSREWGWGALRFLPQLKPLFDSLNQLPLASICVHSSVPEIEEYGLMHNI